VVTDKINVVTIDKSIPIRKYRTLVLISFINIAKIAPARYPVKFTDAYNPACWIVKKSSNIEGKSDVNAKRATPTPIVIDNIPAKSIVKLLFLFSSINIQSLFYRPYYMWLLNRLSNSIYTDITPWLV